jgi:Mor family transcriptional regulator
MSDKCFECGAPAECNHHVVPRSLGGTQTIPLCLVCHGKIHDKDFVKAKRLQKIGFAKAKAAGKHIGRFSSTNEAQDREIVKRYQDGETYEEIGKKFNISRMSIWRRLKKANAIKDSQPA